MKRFLPSLLLSLVFTTVASAAFVTVPDNGGGTAQMPIQAPYPSINPMVIYNGLPVGSQININAVWLAPTVSAEQPGGGLGGTQSAGGGPLMQWTMQGTGAFAAYNRVLVMPGIAAPGGVASFSDPAFNVIGSSYEVHAAPRTAFAPVQNYTTYLHRMFSQIGCCGDPDFDLLRLVAGNDFGLPSPGQTKLTQVGPNWNVESFFDIQYRIDFVGRPGGPFGGMSGSSTAISRFQIGMPIVPEPTSMAILLLGSVGFIVVRRSR
ncbi:MAG: PEP-CTERM sorting domain-containing protein [Bythopirellula sp.]|nr:PEP-CTERM sorting domain-containing protein [Bythopirellula sp.]